VASLRHHHHHRPEATLRDTASPPLPLAAPLPSPAPPPSPPPPPTLPSLPPLTPLKPGQTLAAGDLTRQKLQGLAHRARCLPPPSPDSCLQRPRHVRWLRATWVGADCSGKMRDTTIYLTFANSAFRCPNPRRRPPCVSHHSRRPHLTRERVELEGSHARWKGSCLGNHLRNATRCR
jgi:hypothetical protein